MEKYTFKQLALATLVAATTLFLTFFAIYFMGYYDSPGPLDAKKVVLIPKGASLSNVAHRLQEEGVIDYPLFFEAHLRLRYVAGHVRAGEFEFQPHQTPRQVYETLSSGTFVQHALMIPEGTRTKEVLATIHDLKFLTADEKPEVKEGELLPETYYYTRGESESAVINRMREAMKTTLNKEWNQHKAGHFLQTPEEVLILASIVEKETSIPAERPRVAAVFLNRLKKGMLLQSDPTVIYGLEYEHKKPIQELSKADLITPSSYNTYLNKGLPPTPICNPGKAAIEAVMKPMDTEDLYFVANGTGGHEFSKTYEEHKVHHQKLRNMRAANKEE